MRHIYFVRHSIRDVNVHDDFNAPLTDEGKRLALKLIPTLSDIEISTIYSSPYKRAIDTISPIAKSKNMDIQLVTGFKERVIGDWVDDFDGFTRNQWLNFDYALSNGESLNQVRHRVTQSFDEVIRNSEGNILISGHGTSLAMLLSSLTEQFTYDDWKSMTMPDLYCLNIESEIKKLNRILLF